MNTQRQADSRAIAQQGTENGHIASDQEAAWDQGRKGIKEKAMLAYPFTLKADRKAGGYVVTFRDIPEAISQGESRADALKNAQAALETAMQFYFHAVPSTNRRIVPMPSAAKRSEVLVTLPISEAFKVLLLNEMVSQNVNHRNSPGACTLQSRR